MDCVSTGPRERTFALVARPGGRGVPCRVESAQAELALRHRCSKAMVALCVPGSLAAGWARGWTPGTVPTTDDVSASSGAKPLAMRPVRTRDVRPGMRRGLRACVRVARAELGCLLGAAREWRRGPAWSCSRGPPRALRSYTRTAGLGIGRVLIYALAAVSDSVPCHAAG